MYNEKLLLAVIGYPVYTGHFPKAMSMYMSGDKITSSEVQLK